MITSNKNKQLVLSVIASMVFSAGACAGNVKIVGTIDGYVPVKEPSSLTARNESPEKHILFQKVELSPEAQTWLAQHADDTSVPHTITAGDSALPTQVQLDMNDVPVLDQGQHGTCVTFAVSGALDAARGKEDYVSQLCNLELGAYLEKQDPTHDSGWDGSWGDVVLDQVRDYGIISMVSQRSNGCAGKYEYPRNNSRDTGHPMPTDEFAKYSENIMKDISYKTLAGHEDAFSSKVNTPTVLMQIKQALNKGHRLTFGTLLDVSVGHNGALGTYKVKYDTWMMTPEIRKDAQTKGKIEAGHEMIITGYDDNAVVMGPDHTKQIGVLTLRNSWGSDAGDNGAYYMTYAHFRVLADEVYEIIPAEKK